MVSIFKFWPPLVAGVALLVVIIVSAKGVVAQDGEKETVRLPADPDAWLNSPPISNEILKGKAAILYFYEEG